MFKCIFPLCFLRASLTYSPSIRRLWEVLSLLEPRTKWDRTLTGTVSTVIGSVEETTAGVFLFF